LGWHYDLLSTLLEIVDSLNYRTDKINLFFEKGNIDELSILFYFSGNTVHINEIFIIRYEFFIRRKALFSLSHIDSQPILAFPFIPDIIIL
jgi:hypothetical protein